MKLLILGVIGLLLVAGVFVVASVQNDDTEESDIPTSSCVGTCGNSCTAESNCGRATYGVVSGGSCGCS